MLLFLAMIFDCKEYRIPNPLIFIGISTGLIFSILFKGFEGVLISLGGIIVPVVILGVLFLLKMLGAGDIKLFSLVGSFVGASEVKDVMIHAFFIGASISVIQMIRYKNFFCRIQYLINYISRVVNEKKISAYYDRKLSGNEAIIHFSIAIFVSVLYLFMKGELL